MVCFLGLSRSCRQGSCTAANSHKQKFAAPRKQSQFGTLRCRSWEPPTASLHAANKADEMLDKGDLDGRALWGRIHEAVLELGREAPGEGERVQ